MKVIELHAENFKRLRAVTIQPGDNPVVQISGRNAQGKSSAIDAIWAALQGAAVLKNTPIPIRKGAAEAEVRLDLGEYSVTRKWTSSGNTYLTVTAGDGKKVNSPQKLLDSLVGDLCFDPLAFLRLSSKEQVAGLLDLLKIDVAGLDAEREKAYQERTLVNREVKAIEARTPTVSPEEVRYAAMEPIDVSELLEQLKKATEANQARKDAIAAEAVAHDDLGKANIEVERAREVFFRAQQAASAAKAKAEEASASVHGVEEPIDTDSIQEQINSASETNEAIRSAKMRVKVGEKEKAELRDKERESKALTRAIEVAEERKRELLAAAKMPVPGLSLSEDGTGLTLNGIPLQQSSRSEQLRVTVGMAMAQHPELRVMRIEDASILDAESMRMISDLAKEKDYQVWMEVVDESGNVGIVIEDGEVV